MFKKLGNMMNNIASNQYEEHVQKNETIEQLFNTHVDNPTQYVKGIGQIEVDKNNVAGIASKMLLNTAIVEYTDYLLAVDVTTNSMVVLTLDNGEVIDDVKFTDADYKIKKESKIADEFVGSLMPRRKDRYNRERFVVTGNGLTFRFLIGDHLVEGTDYPYDNTELVAALKQLIKNKK